MTSDGNGPLRGGAPDVFRIRLVSACQRTEMKVGPYHFSSDYSLEVADALLCEWAPSSDLLKFRGPKGWYCCEPSVDPNAKNPAWRRLISRLRPTEHLYHANSNEAFRVPHITRESETNFDLPPSRLNKAISVLSNFGGPIHQRTRDMRLRVEFAIHPRVDLYGRAFGWRRFRPHWWMRKGVPANYRGELAGYWTDIARFENMARYHAAVCLESSCEPHYFTEKFVGAAIVGCVPIYHAHPTVSSTFLKGAAWVDPADFAFDPSATLEHALNADREAYASTNYAWLASPAAQATTAEEVFRRIGQILSRPG